MTASLSTVISDRWAKNCQSSGNALPAPGGQSVGNDYSILTKDK